MEVFEADQTDLRASTDITLVVKEGGDEASEDEETATTETS